MSIQIAVSPEQRQAGRRNMIVLLSTTFMVVGSRFLWFRLLPLQLRALGANDAQVGVVFAIMLLLIGPTQLLGGIISDRWGRRYAISIPSLLLVLPLLIGALARSWVGLAITAWLISVIGGIQQPGFQALLAESASDDRRGRAFGLFYTTTACATMIGPLIGAQLLPELDVSGLIWCNLALVLCAGLARFFILREGQFADASATASSIKIGMILKEPLIIRLMIVNSLYLLLLGVTHDGPFVALHAADSMGLDEQAVNLLFAVGGIGAIVVSVIGGSLADRAGGRQIGALAFSIHVVALLAWALFGLAGWSGYTLFGLSWIAVQIGIVGYTMWVSAYAPVAVRGRVLGIVGAVGGIFSAIGPQLGTWLRSASFPVAANLSRWDSEIALRLASSTPFMLAAIVALALAILLMRMSGRHESFRSTGDRVGTTTL